MMMNVSNLRQLLQFPGTAITPAQTRELEDILEAYPYFQAVRALHLKGLKHLDSYQYNTALKVTAAHTSDREVLFDFITSEEFDQNDIANALMGKDIELTDYETVAEAVEPNPGTNVILGEPAETQPPLPQNIEQAEQILDPYLFEGNQKTPKKKKETASNTLGLGKPLEFTKNEKHSFLEWLHLTKTKSAPQNLVVDELEPTLEKKKKFELLDKFIENNPKIVPREGKNIKIDIEESVKLDKSELMTETLAKVYLEQKKYKKAIQAFKILSLKYPEKSGFFADRINAVKKLQKEKK